MLETPWLLLPGPQEYDEKATILSLASGKSASVRTSDVAMRGHVAIGSSGGWLVTVDERGALRMANPVTGAHADLPPISTVPFLHPVSGGDWFCLDVNPFLQIRFGGLPPPPEHKDWPKARTYTLKASQMRQVFYRKVVLSASPRPGSYAAMLIMDRSIGAPAFATAEDPAWRMAPSRDGVEDAIHHGGRFLSITYTGHVEAWQRNVETGEFTSDAVAPRLAYEDEHLRRKYLAVSTDGRLMVVLKHSRDEENPSRRYRAISKDTRVFFKVQILDHDNGRWEEAADIGDAAIFVGANGSLCLSTREHQGITPGCVYFTDDDVGGACLHKAYCVSDDTELIDELRDVGVYSLKAGRVEKIGALGKHRLWPPPAWFTPAL
jgi:hypothetical protein